MKKITLTMIAVFALCGVSMAQTRGERGTRSNQQHNPEMMAERMTERMAKEYELDDKQKAELLELNKEFAGKTEMPRMRPHRQGKTPSTFLLMGFSDRVCCGNQADSSCLRT